MSTSPTHYAVEPYVETAGEEYMGSPMLQHFTKLLEAWKQELKTILDDDMKEDAALEMRDRDRERQLIKDIGKALRKIQDGNYGSCETCGIELGLRYLEQHPTAKLCVDCKKLAEIREKQMTG